METEIKLITYPRSVAQAERLLQYSDQLVIAEESFSMRFSHSFSRKEQAQIIQLAHDTGKKVIIGLNAMLHNAAIRSLEQDYLPFLLEQGVDAVLTGDPGLLPICRELAFPLEIIWDTQTLNTSSSNLNFWARRGVRAAILAAELPEAELRDLLPKLELTPLIQVYGAVGAQVSGRHLLSAYFDASGKERLRSGPDLAFSMQSDEPGSGTYSLYEDTQGTQIFTDQDLNLLPVAPELYQLGLCDWTLPSLFVAEDAYVEIVACFRQAADALAQDCWTEELASELSALHPQERRLGLGFYALDPGSIV